jgi:hypothetical protein
MAILGGYMKLDPELQSKLEEIAASQREFARRIQTQLGPALEAPRRLHTQLQESLASINANRQAWAKMLEPARIPQVELPELERFSAQITELRHSIANSIRPLSDVLVRAHRQLPPRAQRALLTLGQHGWYFDMQMPMPVLWELEQMLEAGEIEQADELLCDYFEKHVDSIASGLCSRYPTRAHILSQAFEAQRAGQYALSVPVLLAQTDGICNDITAQYLFIRQNGRPGTAQYVEAVASGTIRAALLSPLAETLPIGQSKRERVDGFDELNRHMVLHGESLDYGTRLNGLKAISLINYVGQVLRDEPN